MHLCHVIESRDESRDESHDESHDAAAGLKTFRQEEKRKRKRREKEKENVQLKRSLSRLLIQQIRKRKSLSCIINK